MEAKNDLGDSGAAPAPDAAADEVNQIKEQDALDFKTFQDSLSAMDRQYATQTSVPKRVHIIGTGSIGKLVAHSLRGIANPPPVTLLFHRKMLLRAWREGKQEITISDGGIEVARNGYDVELMPLTKREHGVEVSKDGQASPYNFEGTVKPHEAAAYLREQQEKEGNPFVPKTDAFGEVPQGSPNYDPTAGKPLYMEPIHNLIVTTKAANTVSAIRRIKHRLRPESTICFLQNGMGIVEAVNAELFPDPATRPNYMQGIITHGVNVPPGIGRRNPFYAVHAGHGTIALGLLPRADAQKAPLGSLIRKGKRSADGWAPTSRYLIRTLTRTPVLCAVGFTPLELLQQQLEKLAVNSVLNPLTVLLDTRNGGILHNFALTRTLRLLLAETSLVIRSLPELQNLPNVNTRFSSERLEMLVISVAKLTRENISSMLADVRGGRKTEVEFINGYIVKRGEEVGIKSVVNYAIMQMVIGKSAITQDEKREEIDTEMMEGDPHENAGDM